MTEPSLSTKEASPRNIVRSKPTLRAVLVIRIVIAWLLVPLAYSGDVALAGFMFTAFGLFLICAVIFAVAITASNGYKLFKLSKEELGKEA